MRPRRIMTSQDTAEILDQAVRENALAVLSIQDQNDDWQTFKSRFLERDPNRRFIVLDFQETHGTKPPSLMPGQFVGISFRHRSRKVMFSSVVEAKGRYALADKTSVPAVRYRWPEGLTELQRRAYQRTVLPAGLSIPGKVWSGGVRPGDSDPVGPTVRTETLDISCGGACMRLIDNSNIDWPDGQTLGVELQVPDGRPPLILNAYYRGCRPDTNGVQTIAVQFVGLELSQDGRAVLQRLARLVQRFNRQGMASTARQSAGSV